jgi:hypothetical protein
MLRPATTANLVPGERDTASAETMGVRVVANAHAWYGDPQDLEDVVTPIRLTIENHSGRKLRIRYGDFRLKGPSGFSASVLSPFELDRSLGPVVPEFTYSGFYLAPYFDELYDGDFDDWTGPFELDDYGGYGLWGVLPSRDIASKGLPEGVLDDGGRLTGFLYFQRPDPGWRQVSLVADLTDAVTGEHFGTLRIPFTEK